jgi:hypothetical protein
MFHSGGKFIAKLPMAWLPAASEVTVTILLLAAGLLFVSETVSAGENA